MKDFNQKTQNAKLSWLILIMGSIFLLSSVFSISNFSKFVTGPLHASSWTPHQGKVLTSHLDHRNDSDGGTVYRAKGEFEYVWKGQIYTSDKLDFSVGYDSHKAYHKGIVSQLRHAKSNKNYLRIYVNPKNPNEAVMLRRIRWGMVVFAIPFVTLFPLIGIFLIGGTLWSYRVNKVENKLKDENPLEPWKSRRLWQGGIVKSEAKEYFWSLLGVAVFWNLISWPVTAIMTNTGWSGSLKSDWRYLLFIFPIIGIGLIYWAFKAFRQWQYFGSTTLTLKTFPGRQGERLKCVMNILDTPPPTTQFELKIRCVQLFSDGDSTREDVLYEDKQILSAAKGNLGTQPYTLPIEFELPRNLPDSDLNVSSDPVEWHIIAQAEAGKIDFKQRFQIPVFEYV